MECLEEDIIDEPKLEASNFAIFTDTSDEIKFHYKLKFPGTYSIPTSKILDLLDNEILFSHLENSVKSYVHHAREMHKLDKKTASIVPPSPAEVKVKGRTSRKQNSNSLPKRSENIATHVEVFKKAPSIVDLTTYDSVHSINIPSTSKHTLCRRKKREVSEACGVPPPPPVIPLMEGLVFERVEKFQLFPDSKQFSSTEFHGQQEKSRQLKSSDDQMNDVIILDDD